MEKPRILIADDEERIVKLVADFLNAAGYETKGFSCAEELYEALRGTAPELILLDIVLPGENGLSVLKKLRAQSRTADIPIIMATAKGAEYDKVIGLDSGADDYLSKPFGMMELISRVRAVLRRAAPKNTISSCNKPKGTRGLFVQTLLSAFRGLQRYGRQRDAEALINLFPSPEKKREKLRETVGRALVPESGRLRGFSQNIRSSFPRRAVIGKGELFHAVEQICRHRGERHPPQKTEKAHFL